MAYYTDIVVDQFGVPKAGVSITPLDTNGNIAVVRDNNGNLLNLPLLTDANGVFSFNAADGVYRLEYRYGGRVAREDDVIVGIPPAFVGPPGPSANVINSLGQSTSSAASQKAVTDGLAGKANLTGPFAGNANTASALSASRLIASSGDVAWSVNFDGSGNVSGAATVVNKAVTNAKMADMPASTIKGATAAGSPSDLTASQAKTVLQLDRVQNLSQGDILAGVTSTFINTALGYTPANRGALFLSPLSYGCKCDGTTDDTAAFSTLVAAVNASPFGAAVQLPAGVMKLSGSTFTFTRPVTFLGQGAVQSQVHLYGNARIFFDGARAAYSPANMNSVFAMRDMAVLTDGIHTSSPVHVDFSPSTPAGLSPTFVMENVYVAGRNTSSGFQIGIEIVDCPWPRLTNVVIVGDAANDPSYLSAYGIKYTGGDGSPAFRDVRVYNVRDAIWMEGEMEGVVIDGAELVAVTRGVTYLDTTSGLQPMFDMTNCHINATEYCVKTLGVTQFAIGTGNLLYGNGGSGTWTAIDITPSAYSGGANTLGVTGRISHTTIAGQTSTATTKVGIRIRGTSGSIEDMQILGNRFESLSTGVQLDAGTNGILMDWANSFLNVVTPLSDSGAGNYRERKTYVGTGVGTTNASGVIQIVFPTTEITYVTVPRIVASSGDGGAETFNVINSSVTTTGFSVQVANAGSAIASGQTRRVNYVAAGY